MRAEVLEGCVPRVLTCPPVPSPVPSPAPVCLPLFLQHLPVPLSSCACALGQAILSPLQDAGLPSALPTLLAGLYLKPQLQLCLVGCSGPAPLCPLLGTLSYTSSFYWHHLFMHLLFFTEYMVTSQTWAISPSSFHLNTSHKSPVQ